MFLFGKKKDKKAEKAETPVVNKDELISKAEAKVSELEGTEGDARVELLNEIGSLYFQAEELDKAIEYYEESLGLKKVMGKSYTDLMSLYNKKRQQAAEAKNDEELNYYLAKVQEMMQISKDMLRGKM
ncbi:MAG: tetratricopeptide repeat protein [Eubacteriales bacterium]|nr:tetratricopeptide repeat protein [Eubacteriales bacterium]